jgi:hypothetical protein
VGSGPRRAQLPHWQHCLLEQWWRVEPALAGCGWTVKGDAMLADDQPSPRNETPSCAQVGPNKLGLANLA